MLTFVNEKKVELGTHKQPSFGGKMSGDREKTRREGELLQLLQGVAFPSWKTIIESRSILQVEEGVDA
jgi:hypothetical protein